MGGPIRNITFLVPGSQYLVAGDERQIEPIEWKNAKGKALNPRLQEAGATRMIFHVRDIDRLAGYVKQGGAKVVTTSGAPVTVTGPTE